jgi:hypothetical protein
MDNFFYSLGILYFISSAYNFFSYNGKRDVKIKLDTDSNELASQIDENKGKNLEKYYPRQLLGIFFFVWTYIGCVGNFPEKPFFLLNLSILILNALVLIFIGVYLAINTYKNMTFSYDAQEERIPATNSIQLTKIVYYFEMNISGAIIIIHYFIL